MNKEKNRNNKRARRTEQVRRKRMVLALAGTAGCVLLLAAVSFLGSREPEAEVSTGVQKLRKLEKEDVAKIEEKIDAADEEERQAQEEWEGRPLSERFAHAVVLGDSITGGFLDYEVLDSSKVVSKTGVHLKDLEPYIQKTADLKPKVVFLALGLNDVTLTDGDTDTFIKTYRKVLRSVIEKLPDARIYINGILPVTKERAEKHAPYKKIDQYNEVLRKMCQEEEITFIDNAPLVKQEYYEPDGEHMKITFYPVWAEHMAEEAGL